jgi:hypothetical protein
MSQPDDPRASGDDVQDEPQPKIIVDDPEDFAKTRQLRAIFDARDDYIDARREANRAYEDGEIQMPQKNRHVFRYLQDLAMTMEPLLKSYDAGREIWDETTYGVDSNFCATDDLPDFEDARDILRGTVSNLPADGDGSRAKQLLEKYNDVFEGRYGGSRKEQTVKADIRTHAASWGWEVQGLGALIQKDHRLKYRLKDPGRDFFGSTSVPQRISDDAFRDLQDFIRSIGLGVQFDTEQQTKIDDGLLEEVDEWRRQNV